jgi:hypothetical protein
LKKRHETLVLVFTHMLAATVPVLPLWYGVGGLHRHGPLLREWPAEGYSARVAGLQVTIGDDAAAVAALRRHVDRLRVLQRDLADGSDPSERGLLDMSVCSALSEVAFLADPVDREARVADAVACYDKCGRKANSVTPERVLDHGQRLVRGERRSE